MWDLAGDSGREFARVATSAACATERKLHVDAGVELERRHALAIADRRVLRLDEEVEDLVNLVVNGEVDDAVSALGHHINECWCELTGNDEGSLVHWLRRLVFRGAWLDQRVIEGELDIVFDEEKAEFLYAQPDRGYEPIILATGPSWRQVAYHQ